MRHKFTMHSTSSAP